MKVITIGISLLKWKYTNMKVYLVNNNVDLGYHVESVYLTLEAAEDECNRLNKDYNEKQKVSLMKGCRYTEEQAINWLAMHSDEYFVEEMEVKE